MTPGPALARYLTPTTVEEAISLLANHAGRARLVAGGTDLLREIERGQRPGVEALIDVTRIPGLAEIHESPKSAIHIGPLVSHSQGVRSELLLERALPLAQACLETGSPQIRNRGTLAGNVASGSASGDALCALTALGARVTLRSESAERVLLVSELHGASSIQPDEMLVDLSFPALRPGQRGLFSKLGARSGQAVSIVSLAIVLDFEENGAIAGAKIALGGAATTILDASQVRSCLTGQNLTDAVITDAARLAREASQPGDDVLASAAYRSEMIQLMMARALRTLREGGERSQWPEKPVVLWKSPSDGRAPTGSRFEARHASDTPIEARVNDRSVREPLAGHTSLLAWLRESAGLTGSKDGCGEGVCGACTVRLDGMAVLACLVPAARAHGAEITTIEGLARGETLHPLQQAFLECGSVQCGFCTPGFVMAGATLLDEVPCPSRAEIEAAYAGNLCRCTGYQAILRAVQRVGDGDRTS